MLTSHRRIPFGFKKLFLVSVLLSAASFVNASIGDSPKEAERKYGKGVEPTGKDSGENAYLKQRGYTGLEYKSGKLAVMEAYCLDRCFMTSMVSPEFKIEDAISAAQKTIPGYKDTFLVKERVKSPHGAVCVYQDGEYRADYIDEAHMIMIAKTKDVAQFGKVIGSYRGQIVKMQKMQ